MKTCQDNKRWSDRFLPEIKRILGEHLIAESPVEEDLERNTDLIVLKLDAVRIASRVRRFRYCELYGHEFTIRSGLPSGNKTELTKIIEGWGDYLFYGFANDTETKIVHWVLGDLKVLRLHIHQCLTDRKIPWVAQKNNFDGLSSFVSFRYSDLPADFLIAHSQDD